MDLIEKKVEAPKKEIQSLKAKPVREAKPIKLEEVKLSDNIQSFDQKKRNPSPYDFNSISLKKNNTVKSMSQVVTNPLYNESARVLGVTNSHDWERDYDKVQYIVDWAKQRTKLEDNQKLVSWIYDQANKSPSVSNRRLDDLYIYAKMGGRGFTPVTKTRVVEKIVRVKSKTETTEQSVDRFLKGVNSWV